MSEVTTIRVLDRPAIAHGRARAFFIYILPLTRVRVEKMIGIKSNIYRNIIPALSFTG